MDRDVWTSAAGIPIRNLWVLLTYAAGLARFGEIDDADVDAATELPDLIARYLCEAVERRLRRNLSRAYAPAQRALTRVRGRIDWLETETQALLHQGRVSCRFEDFEYDTPRNRLAAAALKAASLSVRDGLVSQRCRTLVKELMAKGVSVTRPTPNEMRKDVIARHQHDDQHMVTVATLALDFVLPSEEHGALKLTRLERDEVMLRKLFEKAVAQFYRLEFHGKNGWEVNPQRSVKWKREASSRHAADLVPRMVPDITFEKTATRRIVIDTKFANVLTARPGGSDGFRPANIFQMFAYLASQAGTGVKMIDEAEGILLYPSVGVDVDEFMTVRGHKIRFTTVNLSAGTSEMLDELRLKISEPLTEKAM